MYGRTGRLPVLRKAVASFRAVLAATPADHPDRRARQSNLLLALRMLTDRTGGTALLQEVAELSATLADTTSGGRQGRLFALFSQVDALQRLAEGTGQPAVLRALVEAMRQLAAELPADDPDRVTALADLAAAALNLPENTGLADMSRRAPQGPPTPPVSRGR
jgi:hypothetical protein